MAIALFELTKIMFSNSKEYDKLTQQDKYANHFMIARLMAIKYPIQAQQLNRNGIDGAAVVDTWRRVCSQSTRTPGWLWTKMKKGEDKKKEWQPDKELAYFYMKRNNIGPREFKELLKFHPEEMKKFLKKIEKQINVGDK